MNHSIGKVTILKTPDLSEGIADERMFIVVTQIRTREPTRRRIDFCLRQSQTDRVVWFTILLLATTVVIDFVPRKKKRSRLFAYSIQVIVGMIIASTEVVRLLLLLVQLRPIDV